MAMMLGLQVKNSNRSRI